MPGSAMLEPLPVAAGYVPALLLYPGLDGHPAHFLPDRRPLRLKLAGRPAFGKPCLLRELLTHALSIFTLFSLPASFWLAMFCRTCCMDTFCGALVIVLVPFFDKSFHRVLVQPTIARELFAGLHPEYE